MLGALISQLTEVGFHSQDNASLLKWLNNSIFAAIKLHTSMPYVLYYISPELDPIKHIWEFKREFYALPPYCIINHYYKPICTIGALAGMSACCSQLHCIQKAILSCCTRSTAVIYIKYWVILHLPIFL